MNPQALQFEKYWRERIKQELFFVAALEPDVRNRVLIKTAAIFIVGQPK